MSPKDCFTSFSANTFTQFFYVLYNVIFPTSLWNPIMYLIVRKNATILLFKSNSSIGGGLEFNKILSIFKIENYNFWFCWNWTVWWTNIRNGALEILLPIGSLGDSWSHWFLLDFEQILILNYFGDAMTDCYETR